MSGKKSNKRRIVVLAASVAAVAVIAVMVALLLRAVDGSKRSDQGQEKARQATSQSAEPTPKVLPFTEKNAQLLEEALNSSEKSEQRKAMVPALREGQWSSAKVLPNEAVLTINRESFAPSKDGRSAVVDAVVKGSVDAEFVLLLAPHDGQWLVYMTQRKK